MSEDCRVDPDLLPFQILQDAHRSIEKLQGAVKSIKQNVAVHEASFDTVMRPLARAENAFARDTHLLIFYANASPDLGIRLASEEARKIIDEALRQQALDEPLFRLIDTVVRRQEKLDPEDTRLLALKHRQCCHQGLAVPPGPARDRLHKVRQLIGHQTALYRQNIAGANGGLWLSPSELDGIPERVLSSLDVGTGENEGKLWLSFKISHLSAALRYARLPDVRKRMFIANENQVPQNIGIFRSIVELRDEAARLLGYRSHATFKLADRMAKSPEAVEVFHENLKKILFNLSPSEATRLRGLKANELGLSLPCKEEEYYLWDQPYYNRIMLERTYDVDYEKISEYFPFQTVIRRMLLIFEHIFGLHCVPLAEGSEHQIPGLPANTKPLNWHEDVQAFALYDRDDDGAFLGLLYMDLYERDGKRPGAASYNLVPGFTNTDGTRQHPSSAFLCSFPKPASNSPCLLRHDDLQILFHELGHSIHDLLAKTTYACFHGTEVAVDFGEAPSQMLEHWCWTPEVLKFLSRHFSTLPDEETETVHHSSESLTSITSPTEEEERIPDSMIASLIAARNVNAAHFYLNQLRMSIFDMAVHHPGSREALQDMDITALFNSIRRETYPPRSPDGNHWGHGQVLFTHCMSEDYSAGYYSYMYSKVFAADMFDSAFRQNPMNQEEGRRYRYTVLEKGGSRDEMEILTEFLGRPPDAAGFHRCFGSGR